MTWITRGGSPKRTSVCMLTGMGTGLQSTGSRLWPIGGKQKIRERMGHRKKHLYL